MQLKIRHLLVSLVVVGALILTGCANNEPASTPTPNSAATSSPVSAATTSSPVSTPGETTSAPEANNSLNPQMKNLPTLQGKATVVMTVNDSPITIEVDGTNAPVTAGNFIDLVQRGVYDGLMFHRVEKDPQPFVVQGGDPQTKDKNFGGRAGTGSFVDPKTGSPRYVPLEIMTKGAESPVYSKTVSQAPVLNHKRGAIAMARSMQPDSASSQFYFTLSDVPFLDGNYAVFGYVTQGMDVVDKIKVGDRIESAKVTQGGENLKTSAQ